MSKETAWFLEIGAVPDKSCRPNQARRVEFWRGPASSKRNQCGGNVIQKVSGYFPKSRPNLDGSRKFAACATPSLAATEQAKCSSRLGSRWPIHQRRPPRIDKARRQFGEYGSRRSRLPPSPQRPPEVSQPHLDATF